MEFRHIGDCEDGEDAEPTTTYIVRGIPLSVKTAWKVRAAKEGTSMRGLVLKLLNEYLSK